MMSTSKPGPPFWVIAIVLGLLWNAYGVYLFVFETFLATPESYESVYSVEQIELMERIPTWSTALYGIATITGLLGSILLIARKKLAVPVFAISLISILVNMVYGWLALDSGRIMGTVMGYVMPLIVILIGIILYLYSRHALKKGWLS